MLFFWEGSQSAIILVNLMDSDPPKVRYLCHFRDFNAMTSLDLNDDVNQRNYAKCLYLPIGQYLLLTLHRNRPPVEDPTVFESGSGATVFN